jgi:hypothetical protein
MDAPPHRRMIERVDSHLASDNQTLGSPCCRPRPSCPQPGDGGGVSSDAVTGCCVTGNARRSITSDELYKAQR